MGAENSILQSCSLGDPLLSSDIDNFEILPATHKDGSKYTAFMCDTDQSRKRENVVDACLKHLKSLRHPYILRFVTSGVVAHESFLVTEPVIPLVLLIEKLKPEEICVGLHNIVEALVFLHEKVKICHNDLSIHRIFVATGGTWKLGGFEYACKFDEATSDYLQKSRAFRYAKGIPPEEKKDTCKIDVTLSCRRDAYAFGILAEELLEHLESLGDMTKTFELKIVDDFQNPDPQQRPSLKSILEDRFFKNDYLEVLNFLKKITVKSEEEKTQFFKSCLKKLQNLPEELVAKRLSPLLLSRFVLLEQAARENIVPYLLVPKLENEVKMKPRYDALLSPKLYQTYVIPELFKIFYVRDIHIRIVLLSYFRYYVHLFDKRKLIKFILPQIQLGIKDVNDRLAEISLRTLADLVPVLGGEIVLGEGRKKLFSEGRPKVTPTDNQLFTDNQCNNQIHNDKDESKSEKVLLKDLAMLSKNNDKQEISTEEREKKMKERERRREESKLKREERKKRQLEKSQSLYLGEAAVKNIPVKSSQNLNDTSMSNHVTRDDSLNFETDHHDTVAEHSDTDDWSDWDDKQLNDIDAEIEDELKSMPSTQHILSNRTNLPTSPKSGNDHISAEHSEKPLSTTAKSGKMKLTVNKKSHEGAEYQMRKHSSGEDENDKWDNEDWDETSDSISRCRHSSEKLEPASLKLNSGKHHKNETLKQDQDLGAMFEIKSVEIKKIASPETDFFADMTPAISIKSPVLTDDLKIQLDKKDNVYSNRRSGLSFALNDTPDAQDGEGWNDDFGWDVDSNVLDLTKDST